MNDRTRNCPFCNAENDIEAVTCRNCRKIMTEPASPASARSESGPSTVIVANKHPIEVIVSDLDISFVNLMLLLVKAAFAAIPAIIIVAMTWVFALALVRGMIH